MTAITFTHSLKHHGSKAAPRRRNNTRLMLFLLLLLITVIVCGTAYGIFQMQQAVDMLYGPR
jgi:hypothetical protein